MTNGSVLSCWHISPASQCFACACVRYTFYMPSVLFLSFSLILLTGRGRRHRWLISLVKLLRRTLFFFRLCFIGAKQYEDLPFFFPLSLSDCVFVFVLLPSSLRYHDKCVLELLERPLRRSVTTLVLIYSCFASRTFHLFFPLLSLRRCSLRTFCLIATRLEGPFDSPALPELVLHFDIRLTSLTWRRLHVVIRLARCRRWRRTTSAFVQVAGFVYEVAFSCASTEMAHRTLVKCYANRTDLARGDGRLRAGLKMQPPGLRSAFF